MKEAVQELLDKPASVGTKSLLMQVYLKFFARLFFKKAAYSFFLQLSTYLRQTDIKYIKKKNICGKTVCTNTVFYDIMRMNRFYLLVFRHILLRMDSKSDGSEVGMTNGKRKKIRQRGAAAKEAFYPKG